MYSKSYQEKYLHLRKQFPVINYKSHNFYSGKNAVSITYHFDLAGRTDFYPKLTFPIRDFYNPGGINENQFNNILFQTGMVELVSYWKAACPPVIKIEAYSLDQQQVEWWKKLYFNGLAEFFYTNGITVNSGDFVIIQPGKKDISALRGNTTKKSIVLPFGGGKDSIVALELLKNRGYRIFPLVINPVESQLKMLSLAGFERQDLIEVKREIDPELLRLNREGFLNGHTPFSAVIAFTSLIGALLTGSGFIALANESSANEPTVPGTQINHQYSKSIEFENDFRWYTKKYITPDVDYFSLLRPLNELQIAKRFSSLEKYHDHFRSCNAGRKTDTWCGRCPKCLFTYIILAPFMERYRLISIFGHDLFSDGSLVPILDQMTGHSPEKPFECIGTVTEIRVALDRMTRSDKKHREALLAHYQQTKGDMNNREDEFEDMLRVIDPDNFVPSQFENLLIKES